MGKTETAQHTPGLLRSDGDNLVAADGYPLTGVTGSGATALRQRCVANARRAVACWNACQGIPTEALEAGAIGKLVYAARMAYREQYGQVPNGWDVAEGLREALVLIDTAQAEGE
ncbi:MAG: hypothetical protein ABIG68_01145 [Acidobacteriota bacterium]